MNERLGKRTEREYFSRNHAHALTNARIYTLVLDISHARAR